ncbi:MAG: anti-sigma factor [Betaproteobacteria bacterium]|nr:anti-sigma factor [Betaproteobacteria bacterium]MBL8534351.1 anti-sigma factor [Betaproteobacteria bacterium]
MKLKDPKARTLIAAEYVLGTLNGRARARFELWLRSDPALRREVAQWQQHLEPLGGALPEVAPAPAVWRNIESRINPQQASVRSQPWWSSLAFWRWSSVGTAALATALFAYVMITPLQHAPMPEDAMVVVMADDTARPQMTVAWTMDPVGRPRLRVRVIGHQTMEPDTAWELWALPKGEGSPRSLGLITTHETQWVEVPAEMRSLVNGAAGMAMSVEPRGGSPTGKPSGPVLYSGRCVRI